MMVIERVRRPVCQTHKPNSSGDWRGGT